jgi:hypothetical protein
MCISLYKYTKFIVARLRIPIQDLVVTGGKTKPTRLNNIHILFPDESCFTRKDVVNSLTHVRLIHIFDRIKIRIRLQHQKLPILMQY